MCYTVPKNTWFCLCIMDVNFYSFARRQDSTCTQHNQDFMISNYAHIFSIVTNYTAKSLRWKLLFKSRK